MHILTAVSEEDSRRRTAANCAKLAASAKTEGLRAHWLRMEQFWLARPAQEATHEQTATPKADLVTQDDSVVLLP